MTTKDMKPGRPGGGLYSIFGRWGYAVFTISFSPISSRAGYQSLDISLELVVKMAHFLRNAND